MASPKRITQRERLFIQKMLAKHPAVCVICFVALLVFYAYDNRSTDKKQQTQNSAPTQRQTVEIDGFNVINVTAFDVSEGAKTAPQPAVQQLSSAKKEKGAQSSQSAKHQANWTYENLQQHWYKHGAEFPEYHSAGEYGRGALDFFANPPSGTLRKQRGNGDQLFYHPPSNTFGSTASDGTPKTFFRPDTGIRYWNRQ